MNKKRAWLQDCIDKHGLSRKGLASSLCLKDSQLIYQWIAGIRNPSRENRIALARILGEGVLLKFAEEELQLLKDSDTAA